MATRPEDQSSGFFCCAPPPPQQQQVGKKRGGGVAAGGGGARRAAVQPAPGLDEDAVIARELNELTFQERQRVYEEVHGVADAVEETPEFTERCLLDFDRAVSELPYSKRRDLDRAFFLKPAVRKDEKFKLMFLRADGYDARLAAERMARYFANKSQLFGAERLVKKITLDDLEQADIDYLHTGSNVVLFHKDRQGRPVWFTYSDKYDFEKVDSMMRSFWYLNMAVLEDENTEKVGIASAMYIAGKNGSKVDGFDGRQEQEQQQQEEEEKEKAWPKPERISEFFRRAGQVHNALPVRVTSFHFCSEDPGAKILLSAIRVAFGKQFRLRVRTHFGSQMEMQYSLGSFGIRSQGILKDGKEKTEHVEAFLRFRRETEQQESERVSHEESTKGLIASPSPSDVVLGRGRPYQNFIGNQRFLALIDEYMERYLRCNSQFETSCLILDVVKSVNEYGGRFLKRAEDGWEVVSEKVARTKTGASFRTRNAKAAEDVKTASSHVSAGLPTSPMSLSIDVPGSMRQVKRAKHDPSMLDPSMLDPSMLDPRMVDPFSVQSSQFLP